MVWVSQNMYIPMTRGALRAQCIQCILRVRRIACQSLRDLNMSYRVKNCFKFRNLNGTYPYFLIYNHVNFDTRFCLSLKHLVQSPFLIVVRWTTKKQFGRNPPVGHVYSLGSSFKRNRYSPIVIAAIYVPFHLIPLALRSKRLKSVRLSNCGTFLIGLDLVLFIMTVVWVYEIMKLSNFVLEMKRFNLCIMKFLV